ncbi:MAG: glycosyl hydrolase 53 family protein [Spirochaetales bacterium]|nr:glycosyl hydrolase 53 family protein [Spirochaetales bacterium]
MTKRLLKIPVNNVLLFVIILFIAAGVHLAAQGPGDVNHDNTIDIIDALLVAQFYVGLNPSNFDQDRADLNEDSQVDIVDALIIAQIYVGLATAPPTDAPTGQPTETPSPEPTPTPYTGGGFGLGADVSEGKYASEHGVTYKDRDGSSGHYLDIIRNHGFEWIRIRVLVNPPGDHGLYQTTSYVKDVILAAKSRGFKVLLVFFYSDWWCDPGQNSRPSTWPSDINQLETTLYNYTRDTINTIGAGNIDMVAVGNEIDNAMCGATGSNKRRLVDAGYDAVKSVSSLPVMVQTAEGSYSWFSSLGVKVDVYAISHYLMWHGSLSTMGNRISSFGSRDMWVVETAMYWKTSEGGNSTSGYQQTQDGQYQYMLDVKSKARSYSNCKGIMYWGATWCAADKWLYAPQWGNDDAGCRGLFDDNAQATRGIEGWQ